MKYLDENLKCKKPLKFNNGKFRILTFSDHHGIKNYDRRIVRDMDAIIEGVRPDLVLWIGDIAWGDAVENEASLRHYLDGVTSPCERRKIPWAFVFGNHDSEKNMTNEKQFGIYSGYEYCVSKRGPEDVAGVGNFVLPVYGTDGSEIVLNVWGLDSHNSMRDYIGEFNLNKDPWFFNLPDPMYPYSGYDSIRFNQIMWYWNSSEELNRYVGKKIPGLMFFHIPIPEFIVLYRNTAQTHYKGTRRESVGCGPIDSGLFNALVERGEVNTVVCGHDHINDFEGEFCNIRLAMDAGIGYDGYCDEDLRGGRVIDYDENDLSHPVTYMVRSADYVKDYPGKEIREEYKITSEEKL